MDENDNLRRFKNMNTLKKMAQKIDLNIKLLMLANENLPIHFFRNLKLIVKLNGNFMHLFKTYKTFFFLTLDKLTH